MSPLDVTLAFVRCINQHDVKSLCALMTDDHVFVDSLGATVEGREALRQAWINYFYLVPDFSIFQTDVFQRDNTVGIFGTARGTCRIGGKMLKANQWEMPAAWRAVVQGDRVAKWQTYADNEPVRLILAQEPGK